MLRWVAVSSAVMTVSSAYASFELALLLQNYNDTSGGGSGPSQMSITRWDAESRTYLGRFAVPVASNYHLALDPTAPGTVDVMGRLNSTTFEMRRYDYSTGSQVGHSLISLATTTVNEARYLANGNMLLSGTFGANHAARIYTPAGALVRSYASLPVATNGVMDAIQDAAGVTYMLSRQPGTVEFDKYSLTSFAAGSSTAANSVVVVDNFLDAFNGLNLYGGMVSLSTYSFSTRRYASVSGTTINAFAATGGTTSVCESASMGHYDMLRGFGYDAVNQNMYFSWGRINSSSGASYWYVPTTSTKEIYDSAIVLAPEPGTMIAMGAGVAMLLRRRRK